MSTFKLALGIPSSHDWNGHFALSIFQLGLYMQRARIPTFKDTRLMLFNERGSILPQLRHRIVRQALEKDCTHLLFVDSDQTFPHDMVHKLASHGKLVVGCNIPTKSFPSLPTARTYNAQYVGGDQVHSNGRSGLQQVWRLGCGVMLINMDVFRKIPAPWFEITYDVQRDEYTGEDWSFCEKLERHGIPIWVDHDVSRQIGHAGTYTWTHADIDTPARVEAA